jgi:hypothetical protein
MHCVTWTYAVPPQLTEPAIRELFSGVADNYLGVPGLIRKWVVPVVAESVEGRVVTEDAVAL